MYKKDPDRKSHLRTFYEVLSCMIREKEMSYYFSHLLFKKNISNYQDYIGNKKLVQIQREVFRPNAILENKILFQRFIQENNIPGPTWLAQVENGHFTENNFSEKLTTPERLVHLLEELIDSCSASDSIFLKPSSGIGGGGAHKINKEKLANSEETHKLFADLQNDAYIIQEAVVQHEAMSLLNSSSLNTVRIISYRNPDGEVGIASALSRMGSGGAHVDNSCLGGIFVPIDINKASLNKCGYSFIAKGGVSYTSHPDTGIVFEGFELPYFSQSLKLVCYAASFFENPIIGWDVAVTGNGPILIEGNYNPHLIGTQIACGGFRNHPVYGKFLKAYL